MGRRQAPKRPNSRPQDPHAGQGEGLPAAQAGTARRVAKPDWCSFNEVDDYSNPLSYLYAATGLIALYYDEHLLWGQEP